MDRVLGGVGAALRIVNYDTNGDPADAGAGNGTATVADSRGTAIAGSPFTATRVSAGTYELSLPSSLTVLDTYRIAWTLPDASTRQTSFQLVASFLFPVAELQAFDSILADETAFPIPKLVEARENAEQRFEQIARVSFTRRGSRVYLSGSGRLNRAGDGLISTGLHELASVVQAYEDGTTLGAETAALIAEPHGTVIRPGAAWASGSRNVELLVTHGYEAVPEPVRRAGLIYARTLLIRSAMEQSDRATAVFTDIGGYRLTIAGRDGPTGIPDVDAVLSPDQYGRRPAGSFA